jgi:hypothetical protein
MGDMEKDVEKRLVGGIKRLGGQAVKFVSPASAGWPDRLVLLPGGKVMFIELKTGTGKLSELQKYRLKVLGDLGFDARVLYGHDEVKGFLDETARLSVEDGRAHGGAPRGDVLVGGGAGQDRSDPAGASDDEGKG